MQIHSLFGVKQNSLSYNKYDIKSSDLFIKLWKDQRILAMFSKYVIKTLHNVSSVMSLPIVLLK